MLVPQEGKAYIAPDAREESSEVTRYRQERRASENYTSTRRRQPNTTTLLPSENTVSASVRARVQVEAGRAVSHSEARQVCHAGARSQLSFDSPGPRQGKRTRRRAVPHEVNHLISGEVEVIITCIARVDPAEVLCMPTVDEGMV